MRVITKLMEYKMGEVTKYHLCIRVKHKILE